MPCAGWVGAAIGDERRASRLAYYLFLDFSGCSLMRLGAWPLYLAYVHKQIPVPILTRSCIQLYVRIGYQAGKRFDIPADTSWFKLIVPNCDCHECRMQ